MEATILKGLGYNLIYFSLVMGLNYKKKIFFLNPQLFNLFPLDPYKYMFTTDQATRMQTALLNSPNRNLLGTHNLCSNTTTSIDVIRNNPTVTIYPNPTTGIITIENASLDKSIVISNLIGQIVYKKRLLNNNKTNNPA